MRLVYPPKHQTLFHSQEVLPGEDYFIEDTIDDLLAIMPNGYQPVIKQCKGML